MCPLSPRHSAWQGAECSQITVRVAVNI